ncbi:MAG TPA: amidohydrolase family protein [Candidatus Binataceae bacterium]|nr:amidohydrolase family protein [Candidatus Binataceae bacterium]
MEVIDVDSHVTVTKGLEGTPFHVNILPDGGHGFEFNKTGLRFAPPNGMIPRGGKEAIPARSFWDLDRRLEDLDRDGIDRQVLIFHTAHVFYGADREVAIKTARKYNDGLAEMIATCKAPSRYLGAAPLPMQDPAAAADEAKRAVKELHMPVVVIGTNVRGRNLDMPEFEPFFARINELNVPIIIHSDGLTAYQTHPAAGERTGWLNRTGRVFTVRNVEEPAPAYPIWWMLTHPFEHMIAITRIIYSGMLDRFPNLKFIFEEGNVGYALYLFDRLEEGWEFGEMLNGPRIHLSGPKKHPLDYLEHFHWAVESEDSLIGEAIKRWGAERVLFSSDYPHSDTPWPKSVAEMKKALYGFSATDVAKVMHDNAARLLHL